MEAANTVNQPLADIAAHCVDQCVQTPDSPHALVDGLRVAPLGHLLTQAFLTSSWLVLVHTVCTRGMKGTGMVGEQVNGGLLATRTCNCQVKPQDVV